MSVCLKIGKRVQFEDDGKDVVWVEDTEMSDAPRCFIGGRINMRDINQSAWGNFVSECDLYDLFYLSDDDGNIMVNEHGYAIERNDAKTNEHGRYIVLKPWMFETVKNAIDTSDGDTHKDRLSWLKYWMVWAEQNVADPIIHIN